MRRPLSAAVCLSWLGLFLLAGCGPQPVVELRYTRPAEYEIPATIVTLGIAEFAGQTDEDRRWGNIAADQLAGELDKYNKQFNRYQLVDRKRLKAILDEQDLQAAFSDSSHAVQAGKLAHVDAMIYGTATVSVRDDRVTKTSFDPLRQSLREVEHTKRHVMVAINFTIDDVKSGSTLTTLAAMREYDSDANTSGGQAFVGLMGINTGKLAAADQVTVDLINQCVADFLKRISPHEMVTRVKLAGGSAESVRTGNKLALAGSYQEALEMYLAALEANPNDHEAAFNAGVMYEKLCRMDKAADYYDRAFKIKHNETYVLARERVRREMSNGPAPAAASASQPGPNP